MHIAIIDAEILYAKKNHRFPNLASMKISGYHKGKGDVVELIIELEDINDLLKYDVVYISMVFTDTPIDRRLLELPNVKYGGSGFFFDEAPPLPDEIEHSMPDYHLYDKWVTLNLERGKLKLAESIEQMRKEGASLEKIEKKKKKLIEGYRPTDLQYYTDYSIGYLTRGCFRHCKFCINRGKDKVLTHSPLEEFVDPSRKKLHY